MSNKRKTPSDTERLDLKQIRKRAEDDCRIYWGNNSSPEDNYIYEYASTTIKLLDRIAAIRDGRNGEGKS